MQKNALKKEKEETGLQVDRADALPIKTLDGKLHYWTGIECSRYSLCIAVTGLLFISDLFYQLLG